MNGQVILLGAGPGDPELLTIKAVKALRRATVALVDDLVQPGVLRYLRASTRVVYVGKRGGCAPGAVLPPGARPSTPQAFIHKLMVAGARRGETVVRIKGGDPFVFGRGGEECDALREAGVEVQVICGLSAGIAAPASIGIPVTDRRHAHGVVLVTGHSGPGESEPDWAALAVCGLTLVIYMGLARVQHIVDALRAAGLPGDTPAAVVSAAHTPAARQALCSLSALPDTLRRDALPSPAILVVGDVVRVSPLWIEGLCGAVARSA